MLVWDACLKAWMTGFMLPSRANILTSRFGTNSYFNFLLALSAENDEQLSIALCSWCRTYNFCIAVSGPFRTCWSGTNDSLQHSHSTFINSCPQYSPPINVDGRVDRGQEWQRVVANVGDCHWCQTILCGIKVPIRFFIIRNGAPLYRHYGVPVVRI